MGNQGMGMQYGNFVQPVFDYGNPQIRYDQQQFSRFQSMQSKTLTDGNNFMDDMINVAAPEYQDSQPFYQ